MIKTYNYYFILLQIHNSTERSVVLNSINLMSSGRYRCEVSGEAPNFNTVSDHSDMSVVGKYIDNKIIVKYFLFKFVNFYCVPHSTEYCWNLATEYCVKDFWKISRKLSPILNISNISAIKNVGWNLSLQYFKSFIVILLQDFSNTLCCLGYVIMLQLIQHFKHSSLININNRYFQICTVINSFKFIL